MSFLKNPKTKKRKKAHGFLKRSKNRAGKKTINRRRGKKRKRISV